jgi:hypothetical protein
MEGKSEKLRGIFSVKCIRYGSRIKIRHLDNVKLKTHEHIGDTLVHDFKIMKGVDAGVYECNLTDLFLVTTKKLPVFYINVTYTDRLKEYLLYRVYLCFTITDDIKTEKYLLNNELNGEYSLEIAIDGKRKEINDTIEYYPGNKKIFKKLENFAKDESMIELTQSLVDEITLKLLEKSRKEFRNIKPPTNIISLKDYKWND